MSARQPFVPQRPASRIVKGAFPSNQDVPDDRFRHTGLLNDSPKGRSQDQNSGGLKPLNANKPLNISAFLKKKEPHNVSAQNRCSAEHGPRETNFPQPTVVAPQPVSPFVPRSPLFLSENANLAPSMNSGSQGNPGGDFSQNQAHISSRRPLSEDIGHKKAANERRAQHSSPVSMNDPEEAAYTPAGRITNEVVDIDEDSDRSRGPRLPSGRSSIDLGVETEGQQQGGLTIQAHDFEQPSKSRMLRRSTKRIERPDDEDDEMEYSLAVKRSKQAGSGSDGRVNFPTVFTQQSSSSPHRNQRSHSLASSIGPATNEGQPPYHAQHGNQFLPTLPADNASSILLRMFGPSFHGCEDKDLQVYEEAKKKWAECSIDQWKVGAEELANKFSKMVDFVKDHMSEKLKLYASLHDTVSEHKSTLQERAKDLREARESLVRDGANVVGNKGNFTGMMNSAQ